MLTIDELRAEGYEFNISGKKYEVLFTSKLIAAPDEETIDRWKVYFRKTHDDFVDAMTKSLLGLGSLSTAPAVQNIPRHVGKTAALGMMYGAKPNRIINGAMRLDPRVPPQVIVRGKFEQGYDFRKQRGAPRHMNIKQVTELCVRAANVDFVKRQLQR